MLVSRSCLEIFGRSWFRRSIGEQKAEAFCEAVNCERSEQEGKFLFCDVGYHLLVSIAWFRMLVERGSFFFCDVGFLSVNRHRMVT